MPGSATGPLALVGVTASGKSALAASVARLRPEVQLLAIDSMTVYRGMDIGTGKPSAVDRAELRYHLIDLVDPDQEFAVQQFQAAAHAALDEVAEAGGRALLVGGTGLYLRAVVDDLDLPGVWPDIRLQLEARADQPGGLDSLYEQLRNLDPVSATRMNPTNRRRVVRALEVTVATGRPFSSFGPGLSTYRPTEVTMVGIPFDPVASDAAVARRFESMMEAGFLDEVRALAARRQGLSRTARQALGYRELLAHLEEGVTLEEACRTAVQRTRAFARRQWAWFRRDPRIEWLDPTAPLLDQLLEQWDAAGDKGLAGQASGRMRP